MASLAASAEGERLSQNAQVWQNQAMHSVLLGLADGLAFLIDGFQIVLLVHWVLWIVQADPGNPVVRFVRALVEPVLGWLRRSLPFLVNGGWDFSPLAAVLIALFLKRVIFLALSRGYLA